MAAWTLGMAPTAFAHPILDAKDAAVSISGTADMSITSAAANNLIKWVDFSIGKNEKVTFDAKNYLNYVTGSARSDILGTLTGGGSIYLVNPNGILIGDGATVNVGSLYLSTRSLTADQLANYSTATGALFKNDNAAVGDVINLGNLNANVISVEGNNITFKNVADVKNGDAINTNVTLTAKSTGEIHIGSAAGEAATAVNDTQYKNVTLPTPEGWTINKAASDAMYMLVRNAYELQNMQNNLSGNYMLAKDIDAEPIAAFTPVGKGNSSPFTGKFDGLDYKVSNLKISVDTNDDMAGLFGFNSGTIENLEVEGMTVKNNTGYYLYDVGAVAGFNKGTIRNVRNTGAIDCSEVANGVEELGGIVGFNKGTIERAYNTGALTGNSDTRELSIGGIAGNNGESNQAAIKNSFNAGAITDKGTGTEKSSYVGGIVGYMQKGSLENAYNSGALKSDSQKAGAVYLGGVVGYLSDGTVQHTYNSGTLNGHNDVGGIVGYRLSGDVLDSYSTATGQGGSRADGTLLTDENKKKKETYSGFDFSENGAWRIYDGYTMPLLTAFMTRADHSNGTAEYNGTATGDVGTNYVTSAYKEAQAQIGGVNYVKDYTKVTPKALTITAGSIDKTYDGTDTATLTANNLSGVVAGDTLTVSTTSATYADKNVGTGKTVTYAGLTLGGTKAGNYTISASGSTTGNITAKEITATFADVSKTYDGTKNVTAGAGLLTGVVSGDAVTVSGTAAFEDKNVGTNKKVNYSSVTLDGTDKGNYTLAANTATGKGSIAKANITISTDAVTKTYDGTTTVSSTAAKVISGQMFGTDVISGGDFAFTDKNAGTNKTVTVSNVTVIDGNNGGNYNVTYAANTASTINRKEAQVTFNPITKTYDGTTSATPGTATFMGVIPADKGKVGVTADAAYTDKNVGTNKKVKYTNVTLTDAEAQNYYLSETSFDVLTGTITRKALELVATPQTITEGEATPTAWNGSVTGFVTGEGLDANDTLSFALDNPAVAAVGSYKVTGTLSIGGAAPLASGNYGANYTFANAAANDTAFTIAAYVPPAPEPTPTPKPQDIVETVTENPGAAKEYTDVVASLDSGANTVLPTTNVLPTQSVVPTNSVLPTGNNRPTANNQQTESNQPTGNTQQTGSNQTTEPAAQESTSASGEQNETQEQSGLLPAQQTTGGQPAAGSRESHLGITYTDINMPKSMSVEALAAALNGEPTQQSGAPAASNTPTTEPTTQNAPTTEPTSTTPASNGESDEEA